MAKAKAPLKIRVCTKHYKSTRLEGEMYNLGENILLPFLLTFPISSYHIPQSPFSK